jgi:hypothetical protein
VGRHLAPRARLLAADGQRKLRRPVVEAGPSRQRAVREAPGGSGRRPSVRERRDEAADQPLESPILLSVGEPGQDPGGATYGPGGCAGRFSLSATSRECRSTVDEHRACESDRGSRSLVAQSATLTGTLGFTRLSTLDCEHVGRCTKQRPTFVAQVSYCAAEGPTTATLEAQAGADGSDWTAASCGSPASARRVRSARLSMESMVKAEVERLSPSESVAAVPRCSREPRS